MSRNRRSWRPIVFTSLMTAALAGSMIGSTARAIADPVGANGTIKVDGSPIDAGNDNDPHPGCNFTIELFGFDAGATTGSVGFAAKAPTKGGSTSYPLSFTAPTRTNGNTFDYSNTYDISSLLATLTPQKNQGYHIKVDVTVVEPNGTTVSKTKVFWVSACAPKSPSIFVGYAYTLSNASKPFTPSSPWDGSANTTFVGSAGSGYDSGAVRLDNPTGSPITVMVTVDIASTKYNLWGPSQMIPAHGSLILVQTGTQNFDGSDVAPGTCGPPAVPSSVVPAVHVTINGVTTDHLDTAKALTTGGVDQLACVGWEGVDWTPTT